MSVISKELFYKKIDEKIKCDVIHYWEQNCFKSSISPYWILKFAKGTGKFSIPIYLLKLLTNYKKINDINFIKKVLKSALATTLCGIGMGFPILFTLCSLRKAFGRLHYYNIVFFPGILSGLSLLLETKENQILSSLIYFNLFIEASLNNLNYFEIFKLTRTRETLMFMTVSATLMYLLENRAKKIDYVYFWFYTPAKKEHMNDSNHPSTYNPYNCIYKGFIKYFTLGYLVNVVRKLIPKFGVLSQKPLEIIRVLFNKANLKFGLFVGGYVALYRMLTCHFIKTGKVGKQFHGLIAGFFSGITYMISPNLQVLVIGITTLLQMMYEAISNKFSITNHFWPRQLLFMFCHGALLHNKFFYPITCPAYYRKMIDACSSNLTVQVLDSLVRKYFV